MSPTLVVPWYFVPLALEPTVLRPNPTIVIGAPRRAVLRATSRIGVPSALPVVNTAMSVPLVRSSSV